ncbi:hypothetical protein ACN50C_00540 [Levilactobacillus brevis]|nr:hypothetical protein [Levilactobacillus brevis]MBU7538599.1 hypothetical protein [Levilactobacillus brevis]MBU7558206.1 hypothetical protein [Levilactobacillus brevis]MBU7564809.1 hypothetical protein [Levilactobacillus brevis]MCE6009607.1 hypothetical protein [Levilactobacillus brevis]MCE6012514.1 hypothetical protein [Levilactobacillus brevis]
MTKVKAMVTKMMLGAMTVATLMATSAGASAATVTSNVTAPEMAVVTTVKLDTHANTEIQPTKIHLKRVTTKAISNQVQTAVDASALNLDQQHRDRQLK